MYINTLNKLFYSRTNDHITLQKGYLNIKTDNSSDQYKYHYIVLKKTSKDTKCYLECYKDESSKKLVFLIDMDRVNEIDLLENSNSIRLRGKNQICILNSSSRILINVWLNVLCKTFGFTASSTTSSIVESNEKSQLKSINHIEQKDIESSIKTSSKNKSKLEKSISTNIDSFKTKNNFFSPSTFKKTQSEIEQKTIAGRAASSIGSIDLISSCKLDILFKQKNENHYEIFNSLCKLKPDEVDPIPLMREHYITLEECVSGQDEMSNRIVEPSPFKITSSVLVDLSDTTSPTNSTSSSNKSSIFDINNKISYVQLIVDEDISNPTNNVNMTASKSLIKDTEDVNSYIENFRTIPSKDNSFINKRSSNANESLFNSSIKTDISDTAGDYTNVDSIRTMALKNAIVQKMLDSKSNRDN